MVDWDSRSQKWVRLASIVVLVSIVGRYWLSWPILIGDLVMTAWLILFFVGTVLWLSAEMKKEIRAKSEMSKYELYTQEERFKKMRRNVLWGTLSILSIVGLWLLLVSWVLTALLFLIIITIGVQVWINIKRRENCWEAGT